MLWCAGTKRPHSRLIGGFTDSYCAYGQTDPPSIPVTDLRCNGKMRRCQKRNGIDLQRHMQRCQVAQLFRPGTFPVGEILEHPGEFNTFRVSSEEKRAADRAQADLYDKLRHAAEVHREVRKHAQSIIQPGIKLIDMCEQIENMNRHLVQERGLQAGIAFPTGCSINHVAAHFSPNPGDDTVLQYGDVMKVDFGTQIDGYIIDCAWTVAFDPKYDNLLMAVKEATNTGLRVSDLVCL